MAVKLAFNAARSTRATVLRIIVDLAIVDCRFVGDWRLEVFDLGGNSTRRRHRFSEFPITNHQSSINNQSPITDQ
jgi:hypothetical protein